MSSAIGEEEVVRSGDQVSDLTDKMNNINMRTNEEFKDTNVTTLSEPERLRKHPLQNAWTLWFFKNDKSRSWEENQRPIITVTTVEDFWSLYNHIEVQSQGQRPETKKYRNCYFRWPVSCHLAQTTPCSRRESSLTGKTRGIKRAADGSSTSTKSTGKGSSTPTGWRCYFS